MLGPATGGTDKVGELEALGSTGGGLGYLNTACRRNRREDDGEKPHLKKKNLLVRVCRMAAEP